MKFIEVKEDPRLIPRPRYRYNNPHNILEFLQEFMSAGVKYAKVEYDPGEYCEYNSARTSIRNSAVTWRLPIEVLSRNGSIYLVRTDM